MPIRVASVEGIDALIRETRRIDRELAKGLVRELKTVAEPVAAQVRELSSRYGAKTPRGIKVANRGATILVRQSIGGRGIRRSFGSLLMRTAFLPAVEDRQEEVTAGVERFIDGLISGYGK